MSTPILATKLFIPPPPPKVVVRARLIERLSEGLHRKLTLVSASAGSGKSTLVSGWTQGCRRPAAWLSLDEGDSDPKRFLAYLVAALQTITPGIGSGMLGLLDSPQPLSTESLLTGLLNEIAAVPDDLVLVLDDYHLVEGKALDPVLTFLLEHMPPQMHLVVATREDPHLPLARFRARGELTELRAADLRFTPSETALFLNEAMDLGLSTTDTTALEARTEGWITGLQLAAISMQGSKDATSFIRSFTGSHHFVLDYLLEEVLHQQPKDIQAFLLSTSILERLNGPLCDAVLRDPTASGQETLEYLARANLFIVPLDNERCWYRYHHLFADLLRQRLPLSTAALAGQETMGVAGLHVRASQWFEDNGLEIEAFQHATAANDVERAARLLQGKGMPLHLRGGILPVMTWLGSLPKKALDERPALWVMWAGVSTIAGLTTGAGQQLQAAEAALAGAELDAEARDLLGRIANNRATLAIHHYQAEEAIAQARRALEYLRPDDLPARAINTWALGAAHYMAGDRAGTISAYTEAISLSQAIGHTFVTKVATLGLGAVQETQNRLHQAAETYQQALDMFGDQPLPLACEAHVGLARISYEWNDLDAAGRHGRAALLLARQFADTIDRFVVCEVFLTKLMLAQGDAAGAAAILAQTSESVRRHDFVRRIPEVVAAQVTILLHQGNLAAAADLAQSHDIPISQARVHLARGDTSAALQVLEPLCRQVEARGWEDERFQVTVLQAVALLAHGETDAAVQQLSEVLTLAEPNGFVRTFVDEGAPMARLLSVAAGRGVMPGYTGMLLAAFATPAQPSDELLSQRELEVLRLIAQGLSNQEICRRLFLALSTVKGHNRTIFGKLQVQRRTEAVARARELGLL
jgi:LuxR family transcriptional regulator, maltose regulon positive regulatory protein